MTQPKRISSIPFKHECKIKECPACGKKLKDVKVYKKGKVHIEVPIFACDCLDKYRSKWELDLKKDKVAHYKRICNIEKMFMENDYQITRDELMPFYKDLNWIKEGKQVLIYGDPGNMKTGNVCVIMKKAIENGLKCFYFKAGEIPYQKNMGEIGACDLLVLDNFAKESFENQRGAAFDLLDRRIHNKKSNILIVNGSMGNIESIYDKPMVSRIKSFLQIKIDGRDVRPDNIY